RPGDAWEPSSFLRGDVHHGESPDGKEKGPTRRGEPPPDWLHFGCANRSLSDVSSARAARRKPLPALLLGALQAGRPRQLGGRALPRPGRVGDPRADAPHRRRRRGRLRVAIHPTAIVDPTAEIDPSAEIGPYVVIEGPVRIGADTRVMALSTIVGHTTIGRDN